MKINNKSDIHMQTNQIYKIAHTNFKFPQPTLKQVFK